MSQTVALLFRCGLVRSTTDGGPSRFSGDCGGCAATPLPDANAAHVLSTNFISLTPRHKRGSSGTTAHLHAGGFATCAITQGTRLRLVMHLGGHGIEQAVALLQRG